MDNFIDVPVLNAIQYFHNVNIYFYTIAQYMSWLVGLIGIVWTAFRLINSRMTVKDAIWSQFYKFLAYILIMNFYPMFTAGVSRFANIVGTNAGVGKSMIEKTLTTMRNNIKSDLAKYEKVKSNADIALTEIESSFKGFNIPSPTEGQNYSEWASKANKAIRLAESNSIFSENPQEVQRQAKEAREIIQKYYQSNVKRKSIYGERTLAAIEAVCTVHDLNGETVGYATDSYVTLDIFMKGTSYLSPSAIVRVTLLGCQILWEKNSMFLQAKYDEIDEEAHGTVDKITAPIKKVMAYFGNFPEFIMMLFCCICLIVSSIFAIIQYTMTIIEYTIIVAMGIFFVPLILFDGTKDIPKKLVGVITAFFVKLMVITICLFFTFYMFITFAIEQIQDNGGMNWVTVANVLFTSILAFVLTGNAPKIAQTFLTGQPQLSMGEFVQGAATAGAIGMTQAKAMFSGARSATKFGINTAGNVHRGVSTAKAASSQAGESLTQKLKGANISPSSEKAMISNAKFNAGLRGFASGFIAQPTSDATKKIKALGNDFLHGHTSNPLLDKITGKGSWNGNPSSNGAGGGGGAPANPFANPQVNIGTATTVGADGKTKNASVKDYVHNMGEMGKAKGQLIGDKVAEKYANKRITKERKKPLDNMPDGYDDATRV